MYYFFLLALSPLLFLTLGSVIILLSLYVFQACVQIILFCGIWHCSSAFTQNESCINSNVNFRLEKTLIFYCGDKTTGFWVISCTNTKYAPVLIEALQSADLRLKDLETWAASINDRDYVLNVEACLFLLVLHFQPCSFVPEYCCAQEAGDSHGIFSTYTYRFVCMAAANKKILHLIPANNLWCINCFLVKNRLVSRSIKEERIGEKSRLSNSGVWDSSVKFPC